MALHELYPKSGGNKTIVNDITKADVEEVENARNLITYSKLLIGLALTIAAFLGGLGVFGVMPRISTLEDHETSIRVDVSDLKRDVKDITTSVSSVQKDVAVIKNAIDGFRVYFESFQKELRADMRATAAEIKANKAAESSSWKAATQ